MDPRDYLDAARLLIRTDSTEPVLRMAAARLYFGAYQYTVRRLTEHGFLTTVRSGRDHQVVVTTLRARSGHRSLADMLDALRRLRVQADESLDTAFTLTDARRALTLAGLVLTRVEALPSTTPPPSGQ